MMKRILLILISILSISCCLAQRKVTPIETDDKKPRKPALLYYDKHGNPLEEPVMSHSELDTITDEDTKSKLKYPLLNGVSIGLNVWDGIMLAAGQSYASFDISADLSIHNWIFPTLEMGLGFANNTPKEGNFTYNGKPSFYAKVGVNYNFMRNSNSDYQIFAGIRGGFSSFTYDITNIDINSAYWNQSNGFDILDQKSSAFYGELVLGVKVKIWKNFSMGWNFRYKFLFNCKDASNSTPWFIPGFGSKDGKIGGTFSFIYTIPLSKHEQENINEVSE